MRGARGAQGGKINQSKGIRGQKQLDVEKRRTRQWGTFTLLKRTLKGRVKTAWLNHAHTGFSASLLDTPNNDRASVSVFLSGPRDLPTPPLPRLPLRHICLSSIKCARRYHPNHRQHLYKWKHTYAAAWRVTPHHKLGPRRERTSIVRRHSPRSVVISSCEMSKCACVFVCLCLRKCP